MNIKVGRQVEAMTMLTKYLVPLCTANPFCRWAEHHSLVLASGLFFSGICHFGFQVVKGRVPPCFLSFLPH